MQLTYKFRLRDKHAAELNRQARAVNFVWNYCNETQQKAVRAHRKWLTVFDLQKLTNGASKELNIHAHTIQRVCVAYDDARKTRKKAMAALARSQIARLGSIQHRACQLRWRGVQVSRRSLFDHAHARPGAGREDRRGFVQSRCARALVPKHSGRSRVRHKRANFQRRHRPWLAYDGDAFDRGKDRSAAPISRKRGQARHGATARKTKRARASSTPKSPIAERISCTRLLRRRSPKNLDLSSSAT